MLDSRQESSYEKSKANQNDLAQPTPHALPSSARQRGLSMPNAAQILQGSLTRT